MATKDDKGGKIRVVVFELEGSNETLQESLRTVASALGRTIVPQRISTPTSQKGLSKNGNNGKTNTVEPPVTEEAEFVVEEEEESAPATVAKKRPPALPRAPQVVDIDFNAGTVTFEDFCNQKKPESDVSKCLVCAFWLKEYAKIDSINLDHVYTCYKRMKWKVPKDISGPLRQGKRSDSGYYRKGAEKGYYSLTHLGENAVEKMNP